MWRRVDSAIGSHCVTEMEKSRYLALSVLWDSSKIHFSVNPFSWSWITYDSVRLSIVSASWTVNVLRYLLPTISKRSFLYHFIWFLLYIMNIWPLSKIYVNNTCLQDIANIIKPVEKQWIFVANSFVADGTNSPLRVFRVTSLSISFVFVY